jgi:polyisoprenyl-teichoic acid--peptidoglycan teichoic acid transferase
MRKPTSSIDGFVPRRESSNEISSAASRRVAKQPAARAEVGKAARPIDQQQYRPVGVSRSEVDESLASIHDDEQPKQRRTLFRRRLKKPLTRKQKIIRRIAIILVVIALAVAGYVAFRAFLASNQVLKGNIFDIFQNQPLKMDANGRSNIVVFGTSEDDPGHEGALLTDSIMVISVDQNKHNAYLVSIPRDLWVEYGQACNSGYEGRINEVYSCYSSDGKNEAQGSKALMKKVGEITGLETQYYVHMNYGVLVDTVDAVGGVSVTIDSEDPRGIFDDNFDWKCNYQCNYVKYKNGPTGLMDGEHALALARARGASGNTYGLAGANFDREKYQRKILIALKDRAASAGTLTNVGKVTGLIDAMGKNLRTNFATSEIRTLMSIGTDTPSKSIKSVELNNRDNPLVTGTMVNGASVLVPSAGINDFTEIQAYIRKKISSDPVVREEANIAVLNGTTVIGLAQTEADALSAKDYTIVSTGNAPSTDYTKTTVYRLNKDDMDGTAKALAKRYSVKLKTTTPDFTVAEGADFIVIIGADRSKQSQ